MAKNKWTAWPDTFYKLFRIQAESNFDKHPLKLSGSDGWDLLRLLVKTVPKPIANYCPKSEKRTFSPLSNRGVHLVIHIKDSIYLQICTLSTLGDTAKETKHWPNRRWAPRFTPVWAILCYTAPYNHPTSCIYITYISIPSSSQIDNYNRWQFFVRLYMYVRRWVSSVMFAPMCLCVECAEWVVCSLASTSTNE